MQKCRLRKNRIVTKLAANTEQNIYHTKYSVADENEKGVTMP